jgi:hypothetical protein
MPSVLDELSQNRNAMSTQSSKQTALPSSKAESLLAILIGATVSHRKTLCNRPRREQRQTRSGDFTQILKRQRDVRKEIPPWY